MKFRQSNSFRRSFARLHPDLKALAREKFRIFARDPHHPSLRTKKMEGIGEVYEGHISESCVFMFRYIDEEDGSKTCEAIDIGTHAIYRRR